MNDDSEESEKGIELWDGSCPTCGAETQVNRRTDRPTKRDCSVCEWSYTFPDPAEYVGGRTRGETERRMDVVMEWRTEKHD